MDFKENVAKSFRKARKDMFILKMDHVRLKKNANEWILYLVQENSALKERLSLLEDQITKPVKLKVRK